MINIAELLKDAPKGMKLYSPLLGEVEFAEVMNTDYVPIRVMKRGYGLRFDKYGRYMGNEYPDSECLLFPSKDCRTWEGWKLPVEPKFKDGDILVTTSIRSCPFIYRKTSYNNNLAYYYAGIDGNGDFCEGCLKRTLYHFGEVANVTPATKEQRDLLFKKMREAGYEWDADKKELHKTQPHYNIANFKPFDKVLVRDDYRRKWQCSWFSDYDKELPYPFITTGSDYGQCIPFEGNEHLLGTTDMPDEMYINW